MTKITVCQNQTWNLQVKYGYNFENFTWNGYKNSSNTMFRNTGEGGTGGQVPLLPFTKGARGAKVPFSWKMIIYFENIKYDPTDIKTSNENKKSFYHQNKTNISSNVYSGFSFDLSVQSAKLGPWLSLHDAESRPK